MQAAVFDVLTHRWLCWWRQIKKNHICMHDSIYLSTCQLSSVSVSLFASWGLLCLYFWQFFCRLGTSYSQDSVRRRRYISLCCNGDRASLSAPTSLTVLLWPLSLTSVSIHRAAAHLFSMTLFTNLEYRSQNIILLCWDMGVINTAVVRNFLMDDVSNLMKPHVVLSAFRLSPLPYCTTWPLRLICYSSLTKHA